MDKIQVKQALVRQGGWAEGKRAAILSALAIQRQKESAGLVPSASMSALELCASGIVRNATRASFVLD